MSPQHESFHISLTFLSRDTLESTETLIPDDPLTFDARVMSTQG